MKLTVDEKSALNPSANFTEPLPNVVSHFSTGGNVTTTQLFTTAVGLQASADATRVETIGFTLNFSDWFGPDVKHTPENRCTPKSSNLIESDLKIAEFILNKVIVAQDEGILQGVRNDPVRATKAMTTPDKKPSSPFTALGDEITFVVVYGGNATPTWKLINITEVANSLFITATRTRTNDITIAMGPPIPMRLLPFTMRNLSVRPSQPQFRANSIDGDIQSCRPPPLKQKNNYGQKATRQ